MGPVSKVTLISIRAANSSVVHNELPIRTPSLSAFLVLASAIVTNLTYYAVWTCSDSGLGILPSDRRKYVLAGSYSIQMFHNYLKKAPRTISRNRQNDS